MKITTTVVAVGVLLAGCAETGPGLGLGSTARDRGKAYAERNCAGCHAIQGTKQGPDMRAPPFTTIRIRYNGISLAREFEAISAVGHYEMRPLRIEPAEARDLAAYIESLGP